MVNYADFIKVFSRQSDIVLKFALLILFLPCPVVYGEKAGAEEMDLLFCENPRINLNDSAANQLKVHDDQFLDSHTFKENPAQNSGSIVVRSNPHGADIYLDNKETGQRTPAVLTNISAGNHLLTLKMASYSDSFYSVEIRNGIESSVNIVLKQGYQNIEISTEEAGRIFLDDIEVGVRNFIGRLSYGSHSLRIEKEQYRTRDTLFTIIRGTEIRLPYFKLTKAEGWLSINTDPSEAEIFINGLTHGRTPASISSLPAGIHNITISKKGYRSINIEVNIKDGETFKINEKLVASGVELNFQNKPEGAEIFIDGKMVGISPVKTIVSPGPHEILIRKELYEDYVAKIDVVSDQTLDFSLKSKSELIGFTTYPRKATLTLDGRVYSLPLGTPGIPLAGGVHKLIFERNKFNTVEKNLLIDGKTEDVRVLLYPSKYRNKGTAVLFSILFPGAGQSYLNRKVTPHILLGIAGYGLAGMTFLQYEKTLDIQRDYDNELDDPVRRAQLKEQGHESEKRWQQLLYSTAGVWGVNIIWNLLSPSEQRKYEKLKLKFGYIDNSKTPLVGLVKNF